MRKREAMAAGDLRQRVTLQTLSVTLDPYGGTVEGWVDSATVWAKVEYLTGRELWQAQQANSEAKGRVSMRYRDVTPTMRIHHDGVYLEIVSVLPADTAKRELEILFKEWLD